MSVLSGQLAQYAGGEEHSLLEGARGERAPTHEELNNPIAAPGLPAMLPAGVSYHAVWKKPYDGMARHAREQIRALATTGIALQLRSFGHEFLLNDELTAECQELLYLESVSCSRVEIAIKQFVFHTPQLVREVLCPVSVRNSSAEAAAQVMKRTIAYTSWERDCVHPEFVEVLKGIGQLWVPCTANAEAFRRSGVPADLVKVVPYPFDPETCTIAAPRGPETVPEGKRFYHIGKWEPRKNQHQLLGAFLLAYTPEDKASLFLKIQDFGTWADYPSVEESIAFWLADPEVKSGGWTKENLHRLVRISDKKVSDSDLREIHKRNNIYVSSALGEAWDIPAFEAKLAGNRLVYVGYGGPEEYADLSDVRVYHTKGPVHRGYGWEQHANWAAVDTMDFVEAMRKAEPVTQRVMPSSFVRQFGRSEVGRLMKDNIVKLAETLGVDSHRSVALSGGFG